MTVQSKEITDVLLAESFKELVCQQSIEKITIKEITDRAGVIRPTFYNHFQDKYELLEWIIQKQILEPVKPLILADMVDEALVLVFTMLEKDKEFYQKAVKLEGQNSFEEIVKKCIRVTLLERLQREQGRKRKSKYPWLTMEHIADFYAQDMCFMIVRWIEGGMEVSPREITEVYNYVMSNPMQKVLREL